MARNNEVAVVQRTGMLPVVHTGMQERFVTPSTDIFETPDAYVLMIDLPGVAKESISVTAENDTMSVRAKVEPVHGEKATLLFHELKAPTYYRAFNLGDGIDRKNIDARYELGVLTIKLLKREEIKPREIEIR